MLSPASLRVCCLAVMAPALTKADRQTDCLPVVLSESFCVTKAPDRFNSEDKINEIRLKCAYSSEYALSKRKPFMQSACWRTQKNGPGFLNKYRSVSFESTKSLLCSNKIRTLRDARLKSWQNTNSSAAFAGKIKLKYTMSKNISNHKNMGLAKANTSLGLQSLKKVKQFSKENQNSGPSVMEDSLNFSDSTDSTIHLGPIISDITVLETNSDSNAPPVNNNASPCQNKTVSAQSISNTVLGTTEEHLVSESVLNDSEPFLESAAADLIEAMDTSNVSVILTDLLCSTTENVDSVKDPPAAPASSITCDLPPVISDVTVNSNQTDFPKYSATVQPAENDLTNSILNQLDSNELALCESDILASLPPVPSSVSTKLVIDSEKLDKLSNKPFPAKSLFPKWSCSQLLLNASKLHNINEELWKYPVLTDHRFGLNYSTYVRREKKVCCLPSKQELESVEAMLADKSTSIRTVLNKSTILLRKQMSVYVKKQIGRLVEHYQRKLQIPCQRVSKIVSAKSEKELIDLKAELLQSEDVKSMSTAALVNLVRKLESTGTQPQGGSPQMPGSSLEPTESETVELDTEECEDIKHNSGLLLDSLKTLVKMSDPYFTDTSEDESSSETEDDEEIDESTLHKSALYKYLTERSALASSSTWLLARNHELEHRIKEYDERWSEMIKAEGQVCFLDSVTTKDSALSTGSDDADIQTPVKQPTLKSFRPVNGFISPGDLMHIANTSVEESILQLEGCSKTEFDKEIDSCARTKPIDTSSFRKRKLVFIPGLHTTNPKFSRLSSVYCLCNSQSELAPCILCTGQYSSIQSVDPHSMALRDRIAILDPHFHPALSTVKDIPLCLQLENYFKIEAAKHRSSYPVTHDANVESDDLPVMRPKFADLRSHSKLRQYARTLSAKYRNKHHRNSRPYSRHKLVFGKWRRLHHRTTLRARTRFRRRYSAASSDSSPESPVHSPMSLLDDGLGLEKKRDGNQFDIDNVIIPCSSRSGRLVEIQYKEIMIPSWRSTENEVPLFEEEEENEETENISDAYLMKRHEMLVIEEKERVKKSALALHRRKRNRCDSRADSSGANTPDPTTLYNNQENVFRIPNFIGLENPVSPSSPATPNSAIVSDDSQPPFGNGSGRVDTKVIFNNKRPGEESTSSNCGTIEYGEVFSYEPLQFPLTDEIYEDLVAESEHDKEIFEFTSYSPNYPPSPVSSTSSTSTVEEEEEDYSDPEWTVVKPMRNGPEQALVLKFAKR